jgi:hypothetical protein
MTWRAMAWVRFVRPNITNTNFGGIVQAQQAFIHRTSTAAMPNCQLQRDADTPHRFCLRLMGAPELGR